jgi:hypothetical protein
MSTILFYDVVLFVHILAVVLAFGVVVLAFGVVSAGSSTKAGSSRRR